MDDFDLTADRRRRRPGSTPPNTPAAPRSAGSDATSVVRFHAPQAEAATFTQPEDEFPFWAEIFDAVTLEFVDQSRNRNVDELMEPSSYGELVAKVLHPRPDWASPAQYADVTRLLRRYQFGYWGLEGFLDLPDLEEVYFNDYQTGFYIQAGRKYRITQQIFRDEAAIQRFIKKIATENGLQINLSRPALDARLSDGSRMHGSLPPLAVNGAQFVIRKHRDIPFTIEQFIDNGMVSSELAADLHRFIRAGWTTVVSGGTGSGKAQPLDAKILTPHGWRLMGELTVGAQVIGSDGCAHRVTGVFPQGEKQIFRVTFSDGSSTECCDDHLWAVRTKKDKYRGNPYRVLALDQLRDDLRDTQGSSKWFVPIVQPVHYAASGDRPIDPYLLGVLLGDGCMRSTTPSVSVSDQRIVDEISRRLPAGVEMTPRSSSNDIDWSLSGGCRGRKNPLTAALRECGLMGLKSTEKFIPSDYLLASPTDRLMLLRGLMDTDGSVAAGTPHVEYSTSSSRLAQDLRHLVQSLGGRCVIKTRQPYFTNNGVRRAGAPSFRMNIALGGQTSPFLVGRKAEAFRPRSKYEPTRAIVSVEPVGRRAAQCIAVDAPDHLYVTDEFIVTHNTSFLNTICNAFLPPSERLVICEDTHELRIKTDDTQYLQAQRDTSRDVAEEGEINISDLIRFALRMRPDRIIVGEVRGTEALDVLKAWNSGHDGSFCTVHADSAELALSKLEQLARSGGDLDQEAIRELLATTVNCVVQVTRRAPGPNPRAVVQVAQVIHPLLIDFDDPVVAQRYEELQASGELRSMRGIQTLTLYRFDRKQGRLVKRNEPLPVLGKEFV